MILWPFHLIAILVGLTVGSFLNVVVCRLPKGGSVVRPRSHCPSCQASLSWYQNIPVISYLALRGKCGNCSAPISLRYPVIELLTALVFLASLNRFGWSAELLVRDWVFLSIGIAVTFIDLEHRIIPDPLSIGGTLWFLLSSFLASKVTILNSILGAALGFGIFYALAWFYERRSGRMGLGGGDIKLLALIGAFLGPGGVFVTVVLSSILGSLVGIFWGLISKQRSLLAVSIPYGPFLVMAALLDYFFGDWIWLHYMIPT